MRATFESSPLGIGVLDREGRVVCSNRAFSKLSGYPPAELEGMPFAAVLHPDDVEAGALPFAELLAGRRESFGSEARLRHKHGTAVWVRLTVSLHRPADSSFIVMVDDVNVRRAAEEMSQGLLYRLDQWMTELTSLHTTALIMLERGDIRLDRDEAEQTIRETNERLNLALDAAGMGVWEWDVKRNTVRWSEQLSRLTGIQDQEGPFGGHRDLVHPEDRARLFARLAAAIDGSDDLSGLEFRFRRWDGVWTPVMGTAHIDRVPPAPATRVLVALLDVSHRRALEECLRQSQKIDAIGQVAASVAHDFNTLLSVIFACAQTLQRELETKTRHSETLNDLLEAGERARRLTAQLLAFSRKTAFQPAVVDVSDLVARLEPLLRRMTCDGVRLCIEPDPAAGRVWADPGQIEQVVMNLVVNARDAMPDGGVLTVATAAVDPQAATAVGARAERYAALIVGDTGAGMPPNVRERIFDPFFTTKEPGKGTGLGLALVADVARRWQGHIAVDTTPGCGTTFRVLFPRLEGPMM